MMFSRRFLSVLLLLALIAPAVVACRVPAPKPAPPPSASEVVADLGDDVRVTLLWSTAVDLDLYVTDPTQETVYYANTPSGTGGALEHDTRCPAEGGSGSRLETATWKKAPRGHYRVGIDFSDPCGLTVGEVEYRLVADVGGRRVEKLGRAKPAIFDYIALEFEVPGR